MEQGQLNWIANFIWGIADNVLRDLYVRGNGLKTDYLWKRILTRDGLTNILT
jgi:hypothetical protein